MAEAAIIVAATASLAASGVSAYEQIISADETAKTERDQIRETQVQLRLQENQASIERLTKLKQVLATDQVIMGERGISAGSGTSMAIIQQNLSNFEYDENFANLNLMSKQKSLDTQLKLSSVRRDASRMSAITGFASNAAQTLFTLATSGGLPSGAKEGVSGSRVGGAIPNATPVPNEYIQGSLRGGTNNSIFNDHFNLNG